MAERWVEAGRPGSRKRRCNWAAGRRVRTEQETLLGVEAEEARAGAVGRGEEEEATREQENAGEGGAVGLVRNLLAERATVEVGMRVVSVVSVVAAAADEALKGMAVPSNGRSVAPPDCALSRPISSTPVRMLLGLGGSWWPEGPAQVPGMASPDQRTREVPRTNERVRRVSLST